jgi:hypothetical protein
LSRDYVGAYWGPRQETALECARRAELFFQLLARCDPSFAQWYRRGRSAPRELPGLPVRAEIEELEQLLLKGRNRGDVNRDVIEELGFSMRVWNGEKVRTRIEVLCGAYTPAVPNVCLFYPPKEGPSRERLWSAPVLSEVLTSIATAWDPDYAMASSSEMVELLEKQPGEVRVGWLTYLSRRLGTLPPLPAPVRITPVGALGWLLVLAPEPLRASEPEHVALLARLRERLDRAGLVAPRRD